MKKFLFLILFLGIYTASFSQIIFENGYIIDNSGIKTNCQIRNAQWLRNPSEITYRLSEDGEQMTATLSMIKEFGFENGFRFVRKTVEIDKSDYNYNPNPDFKEETLFLKVLVTGKANLYGYADSNLERFFYDINDSETKQLVYKVYKGHHEEGKNFQFRQQLWNDLKCENFSQSTYEKLQYSQRELIKFFIKYLDCQSESYELFQEPKSQRKAFNFGVQVGLQNSNIKFRNTKAKKNNAHFDTKTGFTFGLTAEYILPFNRNKWGIFLKAIYQSYEDEAEMSRGTAKVNHKSIEIPLGVRHYFFLNRNSSVFLEGYFLLDIPFNSQLELSNVVEIITFSPSASGGAGVGFKYKKFSITGRYLAAQDLASRFHFYKTKRNSGMITIGYQFL